MQAKNKIVLINFFVLAIFVADRWFKLLFLKKFPQREFFLIGNYLKLKLAVNAGIAFGLNLPSWLIISLYCLIIFLLFWLLPAYWRKNESYKLLAVELIIAGAFSNLFDRLRVGQVIDYLDLKYYSIFNLADTMIVVGIIILIVSDIKKDIKITSSKSQIPSNQF